MEQFYGNYTLGVLGGGQLGRMLIQSAIDFNMSVHILDPDSNAPCKDLSSKFEIGTLTDFNTVYEFGKECDLITIEIENVNTEALKKLVSEGKQVYPQPEIIELIQDKRIQKQFYVKHGIPTADFILTENRQDLQELLERLPAVHKLGRDGYDGRGVQIIRSDEDLAKGFDAPGLLEDLVDFEKEISVVVARNKSGDIKCFPVVELVFHPEANLVEYLFAPASISDDVANEAQQTAKRIIQKLDMVGLLAVEMFVTKSGEILVNEVAPRTHNSGHQTIEANVTSQFEQHLRAIMNMPLGNTDALLPSAMVNILGEDGYTGSAVYEGMKDVLNIDGVHVHLYGKKVTKPFRKMGHVTITNSNIEQLQRKVDEVKNLLKVKA